MRCDTLDWKENCYKCGCDVWGVACLTYECEMGVQDVGVRRSGGIEVIGCRSGSRCCKCIGRTRR